MNEPRTMAEVNERRKAARNARLAAQAKTADTRTARRLGTTGSNATPAGQTGVQDPHGAARRDARYTLREAAWGVTGDKGLKNCGRAALNGGVTPVLNGGVAHYAGLVTCGKIHLCPVCGPKIRAVRAESMDAYGKAWEGAGHALAMVTLTMRHYSRMPLGTLRKAARGGLVADQHDAWILAFGNRAGKQWQQLKRAFGVVGYTRAWEVTHGENGWHPHFHVLLWLDTPWSQDQADAFEAAVFARWSRALHKVGGYTIAEGRGVRVDVAAAGDTGVMARYLTKLQDGSAKFERVGQEMNRVDLKTGKRASRTPFEILQQFASTGDVAELDLWLEYERGAFNVRALHWSKGMEAVLAELVEVDTRTDEEIAAEEVGGEPLALIPADTWYRHIVRHRGRALQLLRVAESIGQAGVRHLVAEWGLEWGRDVLDPPKPAV